MVENPPLSDIAGSAEEKEEELVNKPQMHTKFH